MSTESGKPASDGDEFARQARMERASFLSDMVYFVRQNRKWWLIPLMLLLVGLGSLMVLASTGAAPFIYTLF